MKNIESNSYKYLKTANNQISRVINLIRKGLGVNTAIEQVFGTGRFKGKQLDDIKRQVREMMSPSKNRIPIREI